MAFSPPLPPLFRNSFVSFCWLCPLLFVVGGWTVQLLFFVLFVCFVLVVLCFVVCFFVCVRVVFSFCFVCFSYMDNYMDYVKVRLLSFVAIQCDGLACFSQFNHSKDKPVLRPGESHEGVGRKNNCCWWLDDN